MERKEYSAGAVKHSFWFMEFKKMVSLLNEGNNFEEIRKKNLEENIFGAPTTERATQIYNTVSARIKSLDSSFYPLFMDGDIATQKLFALIACMAYDTLFFDLIYEVVREKLIIGSNELAESDIRIFFKNKQQQDDKVAKWTDQTLKRLGGCYKTLMFESGLTDKARDTRKIFKPIMEASMKNWLEDHDMVSVEKALTGVR